MRSLCPKYTFEKDKSMLILLVEVIVLLPIIAGTSDRRRDDRDPEGRDHRGMLRYSIIVPVLHESERIKGLIDHLFCLEPRDACEIIVVDGSAERDTIDAIDSKQVVKMTADRGRARQMNAGAAVANGDILIFLHVDTELPLAAFAMIESVMGQGRYRGGAFQLGIQSEKLAYKALTRWISIRCRLTGIPYGDQAIFIAKDYFNRIGGYREIPLMEDVELMRRIKKRGGKICVLPDRVMTSPRRWEEEGFIYVNLRNTLLLILYLLGAPPQQLVRFYKSDNTKKAVA
jgi:rSAM/selenodomain-associated transferase 2